MQDKILLETKNLAIGYKNNTLIEHLVLQLYAGELVCLIGRNGIGKSTLIRTLAGLHLALDGHITLMNKDLKSLSRQARAQLVSIVLPHDETSCDAFTVKQIAALGRFPYTGLLGHISHSDESIIQSALEKVNMAHKADTPFGELSDGERQRTMIARALSQNTSIILLDEPTAHLDLPNKIALLHLLHQLAAETGKAILLTNHELDLTLQIADKIWLMGDGKIMRGIPEDLILTHRIAEAFGNEQFHFDENTGTFRFDYKHRYSISLSGDGLLAEWTRRALQRNGYEIDNQALWKVTCVSAHQWKLTGADHNTDEIADSMENLLYLLQVWQSDAKQ